MEKWYQLLERLVVAVENIAGGPDEPKQLELPGIEKEVQAFLSRSPGEKTASETLAAAEDFAKNGCTPENEPEMSREDLKKRLTENNVSFKDSARTETLKKLYDEMIAKAKEDPAAEEIFENTAPPADEDPFGETPAPDLVVEQFNLDQVREHLKDLAVAKGQDFAVQVMKETGEADKLSAVPPAVYTRLVNRVREILGKK